ncbi:MAG: CTP synthase [Chloroflexi bacterium]|nr:MAG: CTP synthase [Chloroflexota bacterium]
MAKYIFVTGGVASSVGKGISVASIGRILKSRGLTVSIQKLDPYLNVDPGTMSPYQHGEVFVTEDGCETDLDLGHYERFIDQNLSQASNVTAGQVYRSIITKERRGDYLGGTIQTIPHVTNEIKARMKALSDDAEVVVVEVGGTVGDIEGLPFLEAIRQMRNDVGRGNVCYLHVTLLPYLSSSGELKTKPTQHSVKELRSIGIQPDIILCRSDLPVPDSLKEKISLFCDVPVKAVIPVPTVDSIYEVPTLLEEWGIGDLLLETLNIDAPRADLGEWQTMVRRIQEPKETLPIAVVGKYSELPDAYLSVKEALHHAGLSKHRDINVIWVRSEDIEEQGADALLSHVNGIVVPGGFGPRGIEGMIMAIRYAREQGIPYLGLCLGMQLMVVEYARHAFGDERMNSTEFDPETPGPVIDLMVEQQSVEDMGGTMRLGAYPCALQEGSKSFAAYGQALVMERHRHRFEFNNKYREDLGALGLRASGLSPDGNLVEIVELEDHPFMVGTQFHAEFCSRPTRPHPLFREFVGAATSILREGAQHPLPLNDK